MMTEPDVFGVEQNKKTRNYRIFFVCGTTKLFLGDGILTENASNALESDTFFFAFEELKVLMGDKEFLEHLEACLAFGGDE